VKATPETSFLEPGVGTGLNVLPLVKRGYAVTGIDISPAMLAQFRQKLGQVPPNLSLIQADASQLPLGDRCFDVVLTVHMMHTVSNGQIFLDEIDRVLKPGGFYLNAQWITPPARLAFEQSFRTILAKYEGKQVSEQRNGSLKTANVAEYLESNGYRATYGIAKEWTVSNTIGELLGFFKARAYGLCWQLPEAQFHQALDEFEAFCLEHYGSLQTELSSVAKFEIGAFEKSIESC
jgi:SAM-dependent methyltransferase